MRTYFDQDDYLAQQDDWEEREIVNNQIAAEEERESRLIFIHESRADKKGEGPSFIDGLLEWESDGIFDDDDDLNFD